MKKILLSRLYVLFILILLFASTIPFSPFVDDSVEAGFAGGDGSAGSPYQISNWTHMNSTRGYMTKNFTVLNDLDSTVDGYAVVAGSSANGGNGWIPLPSTDDGFKGTFDGNGFNISDVYCRTATTTLRGFFSYVNLNGVVKDFNMYNADFADSSGRMGIAVGLIAGSAIVSNVHVFNSVISCPEMIVGGFVGRVSGGLIHNCSVNNVTVTVSGGSEPDTCGGFVGYMVGGAIRDCSAVDVNVTCSRYYAGGFLGYATSAVGTIERCFSSGDVYGTGSSCNYMGGFAARNDNTIQNCYTTANVYRNAGSSTYFAGFTGYHYRSVIQNCYAAGDTQFGGGTNHGFCGRRDTGGSYVCVNNTFDTSFTQKTDGVCSNTGKNAASMKNLTNFTALGFDIIHLLSHDGAIGTSYWYINDGYDYPRLWFEYTGMTYLPYVSNPVPYDGQPGIPIDQANFSIDVSHPLGNLLNITITYVGVSSTSFLNQSNGTFVYNYTSDLPLGSTVYMHVNVSDGTSWENNTYSFSTEQYYYISSSGGNDANNGTSPATPWRTVAKATTGFTSSIFSVGDNIYFKRDDTFTDASLYMKNVAGASLQNPMVIGAYGTGAIPIFSGIRIYSDVVSKNLTIENLNIRNPPGTNYNIALYSTFSNPGSHVLIQNVTIYNSYSGTANPHGIDYGGWGEHIIIRNCTFETISGGKMYDQARRGWSYNLIENCTFIMARHAAISLFPYVLSGAYPNDFKLGWGSEYAIIRNNTIYTQSRAFLANMNKTLFENNRIYTYDVLRSPDQWAGCDDNIIRYNCFYGAKTESPFLAFRQDTMNQNGSLSSVPCPDPLNRASIYHNTFHTLDTMTKAYSFYAVIRMHTVGGLYNINNVSIKNNIMYAPASTNCFSAIYTGSVSDPYVSDIEYDNNIVYVGGSASATNVLFGRNWVERYYNLSTVQGAPGWAGTYPFETWASFTDNVYVDPEFTDASSGDFSLNITSPAVDAGKWLTNTTSSVTSDWVNVTKAQYFWPRLQIHTETINGDFIFVGDDSDLEVVAVNYTNNSIQVNRSVTYVAGDNVSLMRYSGEGPDLGAYELDVYPVVNDIYPTDGSTLLAYPLTLNASAFPYNASHSPIDLEIRSNMSGSWQTLLTELNEAGGFYECAIGYYDAEFKTYYWSVNVSDSLGFWANSTYSFTVDDNGDAVSPGRICPGMSYLIGTNEYYSVLSGINFTSVNRGSSWVSFNGLGFNVTHPGSRIYNNLSSIVSDPDGVNGWIVNWTQQKDYYASASTTYVFSGLKPSYEYILYSNGSGTSHSTDAAGSFTFYSAITSTNRVYALYDPGIPNIYYVATTGDDIAGTGSILNPFATLPKAFGECSGGETIYMRGGTYTPTTNWELQNKMPTDWIVITNYDDEEVIINGSNCPQVSYLDAAVELINVNYVNISGITIEYSDLGGLGVSTTGTPCTYININNVTIQDCATWGLKSQTGTNHIVVDNVTVQRCHNMWSSPPSGVQSQEAVSFSYTTNFEIKYCNIINNYCENIDLKYNTNTGSVHHCNFNTTAFGKVWKYNQYYCGGPGLYIDARGTVHNISIYNCNFYGNLTGVQIGTETSGGVENISIYNCVFNITNLSGKAPFKYGRYGINVAKQWIGNTPFKDFRFYSNTIYLNENVVGIAIRANTSMNKNNVVRWTIANNIVLANNKTSTPEPRSYYIVQFQNLNFSDNKVTLYNNLYHNLYAGANPRIGWRTNDYTSSSPTYWGTNPLFVNPQIASTSPFDFHLDISSPAVDSASSSLIPSFDYDGDSRPYNTLYDRGADEYIGYTPPVFVFSSVSPTNTSTGVKSKPTLSVTISETHGYRFNYTIEENTTGSYVAIKSEDNKNDGTYTVTYSNAIKTLTRYYWRVTATNSTITTTAIYYFTTRYPTFVFTGVSPSNSSTGVALVPTLSITLAESNGYKFNYTIQENTTGGWVTQKTESNKNNGTYTQAYANATSNSHKYYWRVTVTNGTTTTTRIYHFTTVASATPAFSINDVIPVDEATGVARGPTLYYTLNESHGYRFNYTVQGNATGGWATLIYGTDTLNLSGSVAYTNADEYSTKYWWRVSMLNGTTYKNETYYFTTLAAPTPVLVFSGIDPTNGSTDTPLRPLVTFIINETHGYTFGFGLYYGPTAAGPWDNVWLANDQTNNTYWDDYFDADEYSTMYYWKVTALCGTVNETEIYHFTTEAEPVPPSPSSIAVDDIRANWTTSSSIYISWMKGANTTNTYIYRSETAYMNSYSTVYTGTGSYFNNTGRNVNIRYYYTIQGRNASAGVWGPLQNVSLAETDNIPSSSCGASWIDFQGWMATDKNIQARFDYSTNSAFTETFTNETILETEYINSGIVETTVHGLNQRGQRFHLYTEQYYLYNVSIKARRSGTPGMLYCELYAVGANQLPAGPVISSGSINANTFDTTPSWYNITMSPVYLTGPSNFSFVISIPGASSSNILYIGVDTSGTYTDGQWFSSYDGGATYINSSTSDGYFKIWGKEPTVTPTYLSTTNTTIETTSLFNIMQHSLTSGQLYYYRAAGDDADDDYTSGNVRYTMTDPDVPTFLAMTPSFGNNSLYISWIKGTGANNTLIVDGGSSYPSDETDGTVLYNGTGSSAWITGINYSITYSLSLFSYATWAGLHRYSIGSSVPWGGISFNCYNESSGLPIGFSVLISDREGNHVYYGPDLHGFQYVNITEIPLGTQIGFYVTNSSGLYKGRMYYFNLINDIFYNLSFYLPMTDTSPEENRSYLYVMNVYEIVESDAYTSNVPVADAGIIIKRYVPLEDAFIIVASLLTDSYGSASVNLYPETWYKIYLNKTGYYDVVGDDYIPDPPNEWGQTTPKSFKLIRITASSNDTENYTTPETRWTNIIWSIEPHTFYHTGSFTVYFNITSSDNKIEYYTASLYIYNNTNITWTLLNTENNTDPAGGSISFTIPNATGKYSFECAFKKENFSAYHFGGSDGCRFYFISQSPLQEAAMNIPDLIYLVIMIFLSIAAIAFLVKFGAGALSGIGGLCVMAIMIAIKPELTVGSPGVPAWGMFLVTAAAYIIVLFISRGKT